MRKIINTPDAPAPVGPYSQAVLIDNTLYCSGQIAIDPTTNQVFKGTIKQETEVVMKNIAAVLKAADMGFENVFKTTIFLTQMSDFAQVNDVYGQYFPSNPPARSTISVRELPKGVQVEIEVIAHR